MPNHLSNLNLQKLRGENTPEQPDVVATLDEAISAIAAAEKIITAQRERIALLENIALTDELTGLVNRRGLMFALKRELAAAARDEKARGALVLCDLDGFKQINDTHGHNAGDIYLQAVAGALGETVRESDVVARIGGDEFVVLLTRIGAEDGAQRLRVLERHFHTRALNWGARVLPLKASFGMTAYAGGDTPEALLQTADLKLYAQKARQKEAG